MDSAPNLNISKKSTKTTNRTRTPSIPVRQTKTSKIRTELGNQLEFLKNNLQKLRENEANASRSDITSSKESVKSDTFKRPMTVNVNTLPRKSVVGRSNEIISRTNSGLRHNLSIKAAPHNNIKNAPIKSAQSASKLQKHNEPKIAQKNKVTFNLNKTIATTTQVNKTKTPGVKSKVNVAKIEPKPIVIKHLKPTLKPTLKSRESQINEKKTVKIESPLRKSISAMHLKRVSIRDPTAAIFRRSVSAVYVSQTIDEIDTFQLPNFNTPMAKRRSVYNTTPMTLPKNKNMSPWTGCWSPTAQDLKRRLSVWVEKNRKPFNSFNNLRCFGMHYLPSQEENKENIGVVMQDKDSSYEDLKIQINGVDETDINVANEALHDLHQLILEGYPVDQCEAWLDVIRTRFEELEDKQTYWECMAAIDEARGNLDTSYKNEDTNDAYIENLLQKFNVLNLTPSSCTHSKQRRNFNLNNSNIFHSTAINFAVKETVKHEDKKFLVTPIRRSTRQSTAGKLTPGVIVCSNLNELDTSVRNSMHFRTNKALKK